MGALCKLQQKMEEAPGYVLAPKAEAKMQLFVFVAVKVWLERITASCRGSHSFCTWNFRFHEFLTEAVGTTLSFLALSNVMFITPEAALPGVFLLQAWAMQTCSHHSQLGVPQDGYLDGLRQFPLAAILHPLLEDVSGSDFRLP